MDCLYRSCGCTSKVILTLNETKLIPPQTADLIARYMAQRKTQLTIVIISSLVDVIVSYYDAVNAMNTVYDDDTMNIENYYTSRIDLGFTCSILLIRLVLLLAARYYWDRYVLSSRLVVACYIIYTILPMAILYVPYKKLINDDEFVVSGLIFFVFLQIFKDRFLSACLLIHNLLSTATGLTGPKEYAAIAKAILIFYIPIVLLLAAFLFQVEGFLTDYDYSIVAIVIIYITAIMMVSHNKYVIITRYVLLTVFLILLYLTLQDHGVNILELYFHGIIDQIFLSIFMRDVLVMIVTGGSPDPEAVELPYNNINV